MTSQRTLGLPAFSVVSVGAVACRKCRAPGKGHISALHE